MLTKAYTIQATVYPVVRYRCESGTVKKAEHQRVDAFELWGWRTLENPLDSKDIKPVNPQGNEPWIFTGRTDAETKAPILWPPEAKKWLTGKDPDAGKDWRQEEKGTTQDETVGWHHQLNRHEFEQTLRDNEGKPGVLQSIRLQKVRHKWATEQQKKKLEIFFKKRRTSRESMSIITLLSIRQ